jgi:hypothetical protein
MATTGRFDAMSWRTGNVTAELHGRNRKVTLASQYFNLKRVCRVREAVGY